MWEKYLNENYKVALRAGIRPFEFWRLTPSETFDIAEVFFEEKEERKKEAWKRTRWQTTWMVNMAGKVAKREFKEKELLPFSDEIVKIDPEERRRQALESANWLAKKYPKLVKRGKDGKALIYGENN